MEEIAYNAVSFTWDVREEAKVKTNPPKTRNIGMEEASREVYVLGLV